jgi:hypothetical protein
MSKPRRHQAARKLKSLSHQLTMRQLEQLLFGPVESCCPLCASLGIPHFGPVMREAAPRSGVTTPGPLENEERPRLPSRAPHDHSLDLATESNNANSI